MIIPTDKFLAAVCLAFGTGMGLGILSAEKREPCRRGCCAVKPRPSSAPYSLDRVDRGDAPLHGGEDLPPDDAGASRP